MPTDFGTDLSCGADIDPAGGTVSGATCVAQALLRRFTTSRGTLVYDLSYGTDLRDFLNDSFSADDVSSIQTAIEDEATQDERVLAASAVASFSLSTGILLVTLTVTLSTGPFTLVLAVSSVTVTLLKAG